MCFKIQQKNLDGLHVFEEIMGVHENSIVASLMVQVRGDGRGSFIAGSSIGTRG